MGRAPARMFRATLLAAVAAAGPGLVAAPAGASDTDWLSLRAMNIAHQGGENEAPSNTMYSYERALRMGADLLEVDIHTTADGELVVLHDSTVDRTTNGSGSVYDMTLAEVQALDAAHNLVPGEGTEADRAEDQYPFRGVRMGERKPPPSFRARDFRIPTLAEVMQAYPEVPINIEIKGRSDTDQASFVANAEALAAFLNDLGRTEGIMVASFMDVALARFHQLAPDIDLAPAVAGVAAYKLADVPPPEGTAAFQVPIEFEGVTVVDEPFVDRAHEDGYAVHVWTINDPPTMRQLLGWDVDGVMTAEPMRLERVLCRDGVARPPRPAGAPGRHCSPRVSIACQVVAKRARLIGDSLHYVLRRDDEFAGRCAGRVTVSAPRVDRRERSAFNFGPRPPGDGGPGIEKGAVDLGGKLLRAIRQTGAVAVRVHPYGAFVERSTLNLR